MKYLVIILGLFFSIGVTAQVVSGEYFFDTEPSQGNGISFSVTTGKNIEKNLQIPLNGLSPGIHNLFVRVKNASNVWSHYEGRMFYILPKKPDTAPAISTGEWFVDTDPGIGKGTSFSVNASANLTALNIASKSLTPGIHNLFVRVKNTSNVWSHYEGRMFYILPNQMFQSTTLQAAEWFIDTDPGIGKGTPVSIASAKEISKAIDLTAQNLPSGKHTLFIRVKNNQGVWSHYEGRGFNVCADLLPKPVLTTKTTACKGTDLQLTSNAVTGATSYYWKGPKDYQSTGLSATVTSMDSSKIGIYTLFAVRSGGTSCDTSFASITIGLNDIKQVTNPQTICEGESYTINGKSYKTAGTYSDVLIAKNGCDSIVKTILTVNKRSEFKEIKHICAGDSYKGYSKTGEYTSTFKNKIGCDSIYKLQLTVHEPVVKEESKTICFGTTYKGKSTTGVYTFAFKTAYGCDSTEKLTLTVLKNDTTKINKTICTGENYDGYSKSGLYTYTKKTKLTDCDSLIHLTLKVDADTSCQKSAIGQIENMEFKIYPNPTNDLVKIEINEQLAKMKCTVRVMDVLGKEIFRTTLNDVQTEISFINFEAKGVYLINIYDDKEIRINSERVLITD